MAIGSARDPGSGFSQNSQGIHYAERRSRSASALLLLAAALSLSAAAATVWVVRTWPAGSALFWPGLAVLALVAFGLLMAALACTPPQQLCFDAGQQRLHGQVRRWGTVSRRVSWPFASLQRPEVRAFQREMQGPLHQLRLVPQGHAAVLLGGFDEAHEAEVWCDRVAALLNAPPARPLA